LQDLHLLLYIGATRILHVTYPFDLNRGWIFFHTLSCGVAFLVVRKNLVCWKIIIKWNFNQQTKDFGVWLTFLRIYAIPTEVNPRTCLRCPSFLPMIEFLFLSQESFVSKWGYSESRQKNNMVYWYQGFDFSSKAKFWSSLKELRGYNKFIMVNSV